QFGQLSLQDRDQSFSLRFLVRILVAPLPPVRALVGDLVLDAVHECRIAVLVDFADPLMREEVPMELGPVGDAGTFRGASLPLLHRGDREVPAVRRALAFCPPAARTEQPALRSHARARASRRARPRAPARSAPRW